ncbi:hypothetical protein D6D17_05369 [Aureobasidium pullulans]|nr:hypothetical protein D6D17_05369 [Aureobasidium pullulans]
MATTVIAFAMVVGRVWPRRWSMKAEEWIISTTLRSSNFQLTVAETRYGLGLPPNLRPLEDKAMLTKVSLASFAPHTSVLTVLDFSSATLASKPFYQFGIAVRLTKNTGLKNFHSSHPGRCLPFAAVNYPMASITILFDIRIFAMLPYLPFRNLQLEHRRKATLYISFALGLLTTVFPIIRITYFPVVSTKGDNSDVVMYGTLEFNFGIATSCVPFVRAQLSSARSVRQTPKGYKTHVTGPDPAIELKDVFKSDSDSQKGLVEENAIIRSTHTIVHRSTNSGTSPPYGKVMGWS